MLSNTLALRGEPNAAEIPILPRPPDHGALLLRRTPTPSTQGGNHPTTHHQRTSSRLLLRLLHPRRHLQFDLRGKRHLPRTHMGPLSVLHHRPGSPIQITTPQSTLQTHTSIQQQHRNKTHTNRHTHCSTKCNTRTRK